MNTCDICDAPGALQCPVCHGYYCDDCGWKHACTSDYEEDYDD